MMQENFTNFASFKILSFVQIIMFCKIPYIWWIATKIIDSSCEN